MYKRQIKKQVLSDAVLRSGDALFKLNQYDNAITFYNEDIGAKNNDGILSKRILNYNMSLNQSNQTFLTTKKIKTECQKNHNPSIILTNLMTSE